MDSKYHNTFHFLPKTMLSLLGKNPFNLHRFLNVQDLNIYSTYVRTVYMVQTRKLINIKSLTSFKSISLIIRQVLIHL